jgi:hypothetical protein
VSKSPGKKAASVGTRLVVAFIAVALVACGSSADSRSARKRAPRCEKRAVRVKTARAIVTAVSRGRDVCVTGGAGDVSLDDLGRRGGVVISTRGGSMGHLSINETTGLTIRNARFRSAELWYAAGTRILHSRIGGGPGSRTSDILLNVNVSPRVTIRGNEIAWTRVAGGTSGYGIRSPGNSLGYNSRLRIVGNYIHHIGADGIQGLGRADNVLIDRNRLDYIAETPGSGEHSDGMQIIDHGAGLRITDNWISHEGFYAQGRPSGSSGTLYVHGGSDGRAAIENNLFSDSRGRVEVCGLGTGGSETSNLIVRGNTFANLGLAYRGFPGFEWDCDSGRRDIITRNIAVDPDRGFAMHGDPRAVVGPNLFGRPSLVVLDRNGDCISKNCNPTGQGPIGYRRPPGVNW